MVHGANGTNSDFIGEYLEDLDVDEDYVLVLQQYADEGDVELISDGDELGDPDKIKVDDNVYSLPGGLDEAVSYIEDDLGFQPVYSDGGDLAPGEVRSTTGWNILREHQEK